MKDYTILIPITGFVSVELSAETESDAIDKAFEIAKLDDVQEWELHEKVSQGNVSYAVLNEMEVYED